MLKSDSRRVLWYECAETEKMLDMLEEKYSAKMNPDKEDACYDCDLFIEYRIVETMSGTVFFRFIHENIYSFVEAWFNDENYVFQPSDVDKFGSFLEGRMRELEFDVHTVWNNLSN